MTCEQVRTFKPERLLICEEKTHAFTREGVSKSCRGAYVTLMCD
jgi:hypothetical protein